MKRILPFIALVAVNVLSIISCQQEPEEIRVSSISLSKSTLELAVGGQASLDATISPDNATNKKIRWSSSKESVATVTPEGIVEAVSVGTAFITATSEDSGVNAKCEIAVKEKVIGVTGIALNKTSLSLSEGEEFSLVATVAPDNATNKEISWTSDNEAVATVSAEGVVKALRAGTASITATTVNQGKSASCAVTVDHMDLVDLGLSVKWASCNLGASKPTEYGGFFQWAGTTDVSDTGIYLYWSNCPYHTGSDKYSGWTKYNMDPSYGTVDNKTILESMDDAASVVLGGKWRMPTIDEWEELLNTDNCSWTWTSIDGVNGYKVQSKKSGYTDKWIFLPANGERSSDYLIGVGAKGRYWSSSLTTTLPDSAYDMYFNSSFVRRGVDGRYDGKSVRPVSE